MLENFGGFLSLKRGSRNYNFGDFMTIYAGAYTYFLLEGQLRERYGQLGAQNLGGIFRSSAS